MRKDNNSNKCSDLDFNIKNVERYINYKNYSYDMKNKVEPYLKQKKESGYITGKENVELYYEKFIIENAKANIVICHGFGEFAEKYYELIYYFIQEGYSIFIIEHRGHSKSTKLGIDDSQINVEKFDYYIDDLKKFIDEIVIPNGDDKDLLLFAHSMGGGIGTLFLETYTEYFKAAVLSAPMHEINTGEVPKFLAEIITRILRLAGKKNSYLPGKKPYSSKKDLENAATSCKERYEYNYEKIESNELYQSGGPSVQWYIESSKATRRLVKKKNASKVKIPVLLLQAEYDTYVMPNAHSKFARYASNCELIYVKGSRHEGYFEKDEVSFAFIDKVLSFYESNLD